MRTAIEACDWGGLRPVKQCRRSTRVWPRRGTAASERIAKSSRKDVISLCGDLLGIGLGFGLSVALAKFLQVADLDSPRML
jgi:hypothetical protein